MKLNSLWIKYFGTGTETLGFQDEKVGPNPYYVGQGYDFLKKTPKAQEVKSRINEWMDSN